MHRICNVLVSPKNITWQRDSYFVRDLVEDKCKATDVFGVEDRIVHLPVLLT